jgi:hypothetical protein
MTPPTDSLGSVSPVAAALDRRRLSRASCPLRWSSDLALVRRCEARPGALVGPWPSESFRLTDAVSAAAGTPRTGPS